MLKTLKEKLYFLKRWFYIAFQYPRATIDAQVSLDYDAYWADKRPSDRAMVISPSERMRADLVSTHLPRGSEQFTIGDIGSGPGVILEYLKKKHTGLSAVAYDSSKTALQYAEKFGAQTVLMDITSVADLARVEPADYFLMLEILEHVPHSEKVLATAFGQARRGVFFSFPNSGNFLYRLRMLGGRMPAQWVHMPNEHLRFWTATDLKWWLKAQGYSNYSIHYYRGVPFLEKVWPALFAGSFVVFIPK